MGKVTVIAILMALAMATAFVGGLLVSAKLMEKPQAAAHRVITREDVAASQGEGGSSTIKEGVDAMSKESGKKEASTDDLIAMVDYSVAESREAGKMLFRKKTGENWKTAEAQLKDESPEARKQERLEGSIERWLDRTETP